MVYTAFSLNGSWEMDYRKEAYTSDKYPEFNGCIIKDAVPAYWEDMAESFAQAPFFCNLRVNPEYGLQRYPIVDVAPDMALPNIVGNFFYRRTFVWEKTDKLISIYFEGVQNSVSVWVNGEFLGRHLGYSAPFELSVPDGVLKNGENELVLSVDNHHLSGYDGEPVLGLTTRAVNNFTGGITGKVELRRYECSLIDAFVRISDDCKTTYVETETAKNTGIKWFVCDGERILKSGEASGNFSFENGGLERWCPENPKLYTLRLLCEDSDFEMRFGVRSLRPDGEHFKLNGLPYYLRGICEHCYFPETVHPNHDKNYYRNIIKNIKRLGFNFIRFHTYIPETEYMQAADELGVLLHVECPNNATAEEWKYIVKHCRRHPSVVIYCGGNELLMDEPFIAYLNKYADIVHSGTDALFSPMSAMRGLEYAWALEPEKEHETVLTPFKHNPKRFKMVDAFCDIYSSFTNSLNSYESLDADPKKLDSWSEVYNKPRVSHEICIDGTYTDLSLKDRYDGLKIGKTEMFSSIREHLKSKGVLHRAPLYFKNSSEWQRRVRKYCFETTRMSDKIAGFDFLGPIDTHWHTFGYDVGMMNEFYELKPGETVRNVLMYNSPTIILNDLYKKSNFYAEECLDTGIFVSHYGTSDLTDAVLNVRLVMNGKVVSKKEVCIKTVKNGGVSKIFDFAEKMPTVDKPQKVMFSVTLECGEVFAENEWELYVFPKEKAVMTKEAVVIENPGGEELEKSLKAGKRTVAFGALPFKELTTSFRIALAGRTSGNLATVIADCKLLEDMPHDGFCGWQFEKLMEGGNAVCFEDSVPFNPIIEVVSTHKNVIKQAALFEFNVFDGKLLVCSFDFKADDPASQWLKNKIVSYAESLDFHPNDTLTDEQFYMLLGKSADRKTNTNVALNFNDKTAIRKKKN